MLDRTKAPKRGTLSEIAFQPLTTVLLPNGLPLHVINAGTQEVVRLDLVFDGGSLHAPRSLVASYTARMLTEGTATYTARQLADRVEFYGASLQAEADRDELIITLHTLGRHLNHVLPLVEEVYAQPTFTERELHTVLQTGKQELMVSRQKVATLARDAFFGSVFGSHPYGRVALPPDFDSLTREMLVAHHQHHILGRAKYVLVSGKVGEKELKAVANLVSNWAVNMSNIAPNIAKPDTVGPVVSHIDHPAAVQNAIRVGGPSVDRSHPDYIDLSFLLTVLGGYFGSRLMANLREDKGYTYGVGAGLQSFKAAGFMSISTEVGAEVCKPALDQIFAEMEALRNQPVGLDELETVRNYVLGQLLNGVDGPFNLAAKWRTYLRHGLTEQYHHQYVTKLFAISPQRLQELAQRHLNPKNLTIITAGRAFEGN